MIKLRLTLCLVAATMLASACASQPSSLLSDRMALESEILAETREFLIHYPDGYAPGSQTPVVYVTDAERNLDLVRAYLEFSAGDWATLPDMVVVGVLNTDRNWDFVPEADANFPNSGGGDRFAEFLELELVPEVSALTSPDAPRILIGHSFGGVNAINVMLSKTDLFDAYISIGASTWVADRVLFERADAAFEKNAPLDTWLYMSVAEADGGETVPANEDFAALFAQRAPATLDWHFEIIPKTDHFSAVPPSLMSAFHSLFPVWQQGEALKSSMASGASVADWFKQQKAEQGWRFFPVAWDLMVTAYELNARGDGEAALTLLDEVRAYHPDLPELLMAKGDVLVAQSNIEGAQQAYEAALVLAGEIGAGTPRVATLEGRLRRLQLQPE